MKLCLRDKNMTKRIVFPRAVEKAIYEKYNHKCAICQREIEFGDGTIDHIRALAKGGSNKPGNLQWLCHRCNIIKGSNKTNKEVRAILYQKKEGVEISDRKIMNKNISWTTFDYIPKIKPVILTTSRTIRFIEWLRQLNIIPSSKKENIGKLFGFLKDADFATGDIPPDDRDSLELFKNWMCKYFRNDRHIEYYDDLQISETIIDINKHLCSIGGPKDQKFTRYGMGYKKNGREWKQILPYIFPLEDAVQRDVTDENKATIIRRWKGREWKTTNWYIADCNGKRVFTPGTDRNGILNTDYMMLILAPNTFSDKAIVQGQKHLMLAPTHGLAQLAIKKILDNNKILKELAQKTRNYEYFQAIIQVLGKTTENGYAPSKNITIKRVKPLESYEFDEIGRYEEWIKSK